jgi:hypothetical protein
MMKVDFRQNEGIAIAAAILLLFTPLWDARISFFISASIIIVLLAARFIKQTGIFKFYSDNSGSK